MNCPKCHAPMEEVVFQDVQVDRCTNCKGVWFDEFEREDLRWLKGSEVIDVGKRGVGKQFTKIDQVPCPKCGGDNMMIRARDLQQIHIWFEQCRVCNGVFFDAGEFRDLKDDSIGDFIKDLIHNLRKL